jgi:hypothetical protein
MEKYKIHIIKREDKNNLVVDVNSIPSKKPKITLSDVMDRLDKLDNKVDRVITLNSLKS